MKKLYVFIGPPGCGKGTQAEFLKKELGWKAFSAGELLRQEAAKKTKLGKIAAPLLAQGKLSPAGLVWAIILKKLKATKSAVVLDGYPRSMEQTKLLDEYLRKNKICATVIYFTLPDAMVMERITGRRMCEKCGAIYHLKFNPPKKKNLCDKCGGKLFQRNDARPAVVKNRLKSFYKETKPVADFYKRNKNYSFKKISSHGSIEKTRAQLLKAFDL